MGVENTIESIKSRCVNQENGCLVWTGSKDKDGYGRVRYRGLQRKVHVVLYEAEVGPVPSGLQLDHTCKNTSCANPRHLEPVTAKVNIARSSGPSAVNVSKTECLRGHALSGENLYVNPKGQRQCRTCQAERSRRYEETHKEDRKLRSHESYLKHREGRQMRYYSDHEATLARRREAYRVLMEKRRGADAG